jgi:hypothetical protein
MPKADEPLHENEVGSYGDLISRPNPHRLVIMPVPPFESMLGTIERRMGTHPRGNRNRAPPGRLHGRQP